MTDNDADFRAQAKRAIDDASEELIELSRRIHSSPEIAYEEVQAAGWVADLLEKHGFQVTRRLNGLDTAFLASMEGRGPGPTLALIAEYDALPGVGHGCGHNLIAAGTAGAALGLRELMPQLNGALKVYGTPAEECTTEPEGKIRLLEAGAFEGVDACIMFHPWTSTQLLANDLAVTSLEISFRGQAAHASADPWKGANALDGVLLTYTNINALRQHVKSDVRIHGIITHGGDAANVIPDRASARFAVRSVDKHYLAEVVSRVEDCARGAALATNTEVAVERVLTLDNSLYNRALKDVVKANLVEEGIDFEEGAFLAGSSDFGNLSQRVPAFWFMLQTHPAGLTWHSRDVAERAVSDEAHAAMILGAKVLALSCLDLLLNDDLVSQARQGFEASTRSS